LSRRLKCSILTLFFYVALQSTGFSQIRFLEGQGRLVDEQDFNRMLLEAVDEGFLALGNELRQAVYRYLEARRGLKREELPDRLEEFSKALEGVFGVGAHVLEKVILKRLYTRLGLEFNEGEGLSFKDCVDAARRVLNGR